MQEWCKAVKNDFWDVHAPHPCEVSAKIALRQENSEGMQEDSQQIGEYIHVELQKNVSVVKIFE